MESHSVGLVEKNESIDSGTWARTSALRCTCKHQECRNNKDNEFFLSYVLTKVGL
jgi:hypothetical protein